MTGTDYYGILGVSQSATSRAIRNAYLDLARRLHPDRVGPQGTARFQQITEAYESLSDPEKRRAYDRRCALAVIRHPESCEGPGVGRAAEPLVPEPTPVVDMTAPGVQPIEDLLRWLGSGARSTVNPRISPELMELEVTLTPREAVHGAVVPLVIPVIESCPWCGGFGGGAIRCLRCGGRGELVREHILRIRIPACVPDGSVIEVPLGGGRVGRPLLRLHVSIQRRRSSL